jgi:hypothetical protein
MVQSGEVQIQAYLKQHACPTGWRNSLCCTAKVRRHLGAHVAQMHKFGSFLKRLRASEFSGNSNFNSNQSLFRSVDQGKPEGWHSPCTRCLSVAVLRLFTNLP